MSAAVVSEKVWRVLRDGSPETGPFAHGYTYGGHPVAAAAGLKTIEIMQREGLVEHAARMETCFQRRLREAFADHPLVGEVRGIGLMAGIELVADKERKVPFDVERNIAGRLANRLLDAGMICRGMINTVCFSPPLTISEADVEEMVDKFGRGLAAFADELAREGLSGAA